jgi:hypothetical protein
MFSVYADISTEKNQSSSNHQKDNSTVDLHPYSSLISTRLASDLLLPPKPPSSTSSKFHADFRPLTIPFLSNNETSTCPPFLSAKIQSASFTAGTFGSITVDQSKSVSSCKKSARVNINLRHKTGR